MKITLVALLVAGMCTVLHAQQPPPAARPNIILIMTDDMGFSDPGCYGSEINTPVLDALAKTGLKYTQFYNQARCCPTRASLMTGLYPHQTGVGWMDAVDHHLPGYRAGLNDRCVTIAEVLKYAGYNTCLAGKWHLQSGQHTKQDGPKENWPLQRGFDQFYGILKGGSNYYDPGTLCRNNTLISPFADTAYTPSQYYFTNAITDNAIQFLQKQTNHNPFFLYLAYTAPHWPMQAPESSINKYKGVYDKGWESIRAGRLQKMKALGIVNNDVELSPLDVKPWAEEEDKPFMTRRMETYAAMIEIMDHGIGRIIEALKAMNRYENTVIFFLQDNGGNAEGYTFGGLNGETMPVAKDTAYLTPLAPAMPQPETNPPMTRDGRLVMQGKKVFAGAADTYLTYLKPWAQVSNTPFREYKHYMHEGGIATPLIVHWPKGIKQKGEMRSQVGNVIDIMPTILELAHAGYPVNRKGIATTPLPGMSLVASFASNKTKERTIFWEHEMNKAVRTERWKLVCTSELLDGTYGNWKNYRLGKWELYDMINDRAESRDLSATFPEIKEKMIAMWNEWARQCNVYPAPWQEYRPVEKYYYSSPF